MCGRFTAKNPNFIKRLFDEFNTHGPNMPARYNIGPPQLLLLIANDDEGKATAKTMKWGLVPFWDKSEKPKIAPINAKSEEALTKRVFSQSLQKRRCLVAADGFYEWKKLGGDLKEPHHVSSKPECRSSLPVSTSAAERIGPTLSRSLPLRLTT